MNLSTLRRWSRLFLALALFCLTALQVPAAWAANEAPRYRNIPDKSREFHPQLKALTNAWVRTRNRLVAAGFTNGQVDNHTYGRRVFGDFDEHFFPARVSDGQGQRMPRLGVGFGRTVFRSGQTAIKATMQAPQAEMYEELRKYDQATTALRRLGPEGEFVQDRIVGVTGYGVVPASSFQSKLNIGHAAEDRLFVLNELVKDPTIEHVIHTAIKKGQYPNFSDATLNELGRVFHDAGRAGILLQGDPADFTLVKPKNQAKDPKGRGVRAIDPAGWTLFETGDQRTKELVRFLSAESFRGTFLRELARMPMPPGSPIAFEPNQYRPQDQAKLDQLKGRVEDAVVRIWGESPKPPRGIEGHFKRVLASGDPRRDPYIKEMIVTETGNPQSLAAAIVHCGIGVVITDRKTLRQMHEQRQSERHPRSRSALSGRQDELDLSSVGFGNQTVVADEGSDRVAIYNSYNAGNPHGQTVEERRPHAPWHFVHPEEVAKAMLRHLAQ